MLWGPTWNLILHKLLNPQSQYHILISCEVLLEDSQIWRNHKKFPGLLMPQFLTDFGKCTGLVWCL